LRQLITNSELRRNMGARALEQYRNGFTFEIMYQKYVELYRSICQK